MIWYSVNSEQEAEFGRGRLLSRSNRRTEPRQSKSYSRRTNQVTIERFSFHAQTRAAQRGLSPEDIIYILQYGQRYYAADAIFYLLRSKDIPPEDHRLMSRLIGAAVVVNKEHSTIITIWRNRQHGVRKIRRKL